MDEDTFYLTFIFVYAGLAWRGASYYQEERNLQAAALIVGPLLFLGLYMAISWWEDDDIEPVFSNTEYCMQWCRGDNRQYETFDQRDCATYCECADKAIRSSPDIDSFLLHSATIETICEDAGVY